MPIVASEVIEDAPQIDGRRWIVEAHADHLGIVHRRGPYMAEAEQDVEAGLAAAAAQIEAQLQDAEIAANFDEFINGADF
ncbi:MAG TPA: hypothetical protein VEC14_10440 [Reyranellaceae bacterium]|nr:hypothetical protein [Reyranellaceae bacterium]